MCESAIRKQDEYVFSDWNPYFVDTVVAVTKARISANGVTEALNFLCDRGCPKRKLLYLLGMCENRGTTNTAAMTGYDSARLERELRRIRQSASTISSLNWLTFGEFADYDERSAMYRFLSLPSMLLEYSALVQHAVKYIGGKSDFYLHLAKSLLVEFVHERTGKFHHAKVVDLLSAMLGEEYSEDHHRVWLGKYLRRRKSYKPEADDWPELRMKKTLVEVHAAVIRRMDILHPGKKRLRSKGRTIMRPEDKLS